MKNHKVMNLAYYMIIFCIAVVCLISISSPSFAKYLSLNTIQNQSRISSFQANITSLDVTSEAVNTIEFTTDTNSKNISFTVENTGETAVHILTVTLINGSGVKQPNYEFLSETDFYLMPNESKMIEMVVHSAEPSYFYDIKEELEIKIIAEQAD